MAQGGRFTPPVGRPADEGNTDLLGPTRRAVHEEDPQHAVQVRLQRHHVPVAAHGRKVAREHDFPARRGWADPRDTLHPRRQRR